MKLSRLADKIEAHVSRHETAVLTLALLAGFAIIIGGVAPASNAPEPNPRAANVTYTTDGAVVLQNSDDVRQVSYLTDQNAAAALFGISNGFEFLFALGMAILLLIVVYFAHTVWDGFRPKERMGSDQIFDGTLRFYIGGVITATFVAIIARLFTSIPFLILTLIILCGWYMVRQRMKEDTYQATQPPRSLQQ